MIKIADRIILGIFVLTTGTLHADDLVLSTSDLIAPQVIHKPVTSFEENDLSLVATVTDNVAIKKVLLFYRSIGSTSYISVLMQLGTNNNYRYVISQQDITAPGIEYYIQAEDMAGNTLLHGYPFSPMIAKMDSTFGSEPVTQSSKIDLGDKNSRMTGVESVWKNKWLWAGVGILAAAAISNSGDDDEGESANKPNGVTIIIGSP